jgi:mannitol-specific phosphotransferase system IIBC component
MLKYENNRWRSLKGFIVRFILAIAIAIAISLPVEMILLGDEIKDEIIRYHREFVDKEIGNSRQFIELNRNIKTEISNKEKLQVRFKNEMQGREGSVYGYGYISKKIEEQFLKAEKKVDSLINEKNEVFSILENRIFAEQNT